MTSRFRDNAETVYDFIFKSDDVLVECPFCKRCARGVKIPHENYAFNLICGYCGILPKPSFGSWGNGTFMGLNLWLKTNGHIIKCTWSFLTII
jgi:ribosomal protein S27AE